MTNVRDFGARGDGQTDDTAAIRHAVQQGDGHLVFPRGDYLISRPLHIAAASSTAASPSTAPAARPASSWPAPGPALHLVGTPRPLRPARALRRAGLAEGTHAHGPRPGDRRPARRRPTASASKASCSRRLQRLLIRRCRHGIHLANRDRNVLISDCHIYDNTRHRHLPRPRQPASDQHPRQPHQLLQAGRHQSSSAARSATSRSAATTSSTTTT